ncbi:hypothetical protein FEM48_Zijuj08G0080800 [Ziziphus jujuba var. spinosa]|uniref:S-acyltransferase n=1 Tax=Ziziphus jujuba var. spinosa TaxID=714518 RepID=A0A978UXY2_ZIZJJ|nr:hypothetical protein FEM48_Zijuj08G0080800 [Ziziphus jujuba var. spinosa]
MTITSICCPSRDSWDRTMDRCYRIVPCLSDPARRSALGLKFALMMLHLIYGGVLFLFDGDLIEKTKTEPWYTAIYLLLFVSTLIQYFITSGSSPGYVLDAMRAVNESNTIFRRTSVASKQPASSKNGSVVVTMDSGQSGRSVLGSTATSWTKLVMDLHPPGTSVRSLSCSYCNVEQPPRAKHCHDCDKCVLQFDHHCVWLGTCIGQGNHCKFWWYICEETALCLWTGILYITYLKTNISRAWWKSAIMILLLVILSISLIFLLLLLLFHSYLVLTNQTTFELVRRRRIPYLRGIPERVYPFSKGICKNLYNFCCVRGNEYSLEALPTAQELEEKSRPYTCLDVITCRCC